jgi:hypothetical protein
MKNFMYLNLNLEPMYRYTPGDYLLREVDSLLRAIARRSLTLPVGCRGRRVDILGTRAEWLEALYDSGIIEASDVTFYFGNKLIVSELLKIYLKSSYSRFHQKTVGIKDFLSRHELVSTDGLLTANKSTVIEACRKSFPNGFVAKPTFDVGSAEKNIIIFNEDDFLQMLFSGDTLYSDEELLEPSATEHEMVGTCKVAGGERYILQEKFGSTILEQSQSSKTRLREYRVHTFFDKVLPEATRCRWRGTRALDEKTRAQTTAFAQEFLDLLPKELTFRNAWAIDLLMDENGTMRFSEIQSNFGARGPWSGATRRPGVLGSYVRYLEKTFGWSFVGVGGDLFHADCGNARRFIKKRIFENCASQKTDSTTPELMKDSLDMIQSIARKYLEIVPPEDGAYESGRSLTSGILQRITENQKKTEAEIFETLQKWVLTR